MVNCVSSRTVSIILCVFVCNRTLYISQRAYQNSVQIHLDITLPLSVHAQPAARQNLHCRDIYVYNLKFGLKAYAPGALVCRTQLV